MEPVPRVPLRQPNQRNLWQSLSNASISRAKLASFQKQMKLAMSAAQSEDGAKLSAVPDAVSLHASTVDVVANAVASGPLDLAAQRGSAQIV